MSEQLTEALMDQSRLKVDRKNNRINGVKILGVDSKNRRRYSDKARASQARFIEGMAVAMDHDKENPSRERKFVDQLAVIRGVTVESDGNYGYLQVFPSHPNADLLYDRAEMAPETFGLSHVAQCTTSLPDRDGIVLVEDIEAVASLDIVTRPATTAGLFESEEPQEDKNVTKKTLYEVIKEHKTGAFGSLRIMEQVELDPTEIEMAEEEVAAGIDPVEAVKNALSEKVVEIFLDDSIDPKESGKQIAELNKAALDIAAKLEGKKPEEEEGDGDEEEEAGNGGMMESVENKITKLTESIEFFGRRDDSRSFVESQDRRWLDLDQKDQYRLTICESDVARAKVWESFTPAQQGQDKPAVGRERSGGAFDRKQMRENQNATPRA